MIKLMQVQGWLIGKVAVGGAYVDGTMVKDALPHQILVHLQPTASLTKWIVGQVGGLNAVGLASSVVQNVQLMKLQRMVETLRTVASIGAAASALNLGVSVGGFALVLSSLRRVESQLADQGATIQAVAKDQQAEFLGSERSALGRAEEAFQLSSPAERRRYWREADLLIKQSHQVATERSQLCEALELHGVDTEQYVMQIRQDPERKVLRWCARRKNDGLPRRGWMCAHVPAAIFRLGQWPTI